MIDTEKFDFVNKFNNITNRLNNNLKQRENIRLVYVIIGIDLFISNLGSEKDLFTQNLEAARQCSNCNFIVVDNATKIKAHQLDSWYKGFVDNRNGIYIGNGFDSQFVISYEADRREIISRCGNILGYAIRTVQIKRGTVCRSGTP